MVAKRACTFMLRKEGLVTIGLVIIGLLTISLAT
jgi:hypothetical protein